MPQFARRNRRHRIARDQNPVGTIDVIAHRTTGCFAQQFRGFGGNGIAVTARHIAGHGQGGEHQVAVEQFLRGVLRHLNAPDADDKGQQKQGQNDDRKQPKPERAPLHPATSCRT